nr:unnamed protein product [Spirometra erinaceieuropaei]
MLPPYVIRGGQLSELLLINNGNAGDFLELFKSSSFSISCLWLLQPCFIKTARIVASTVSVLEHPQTPVTVATGQRDLHQPSGVPQTNQHCFVRNPKQKGDPRGDGNTDGTQQGGRQTPAHRPKDAATAAAAADAAVVVGETTSCILFGTRSWAIVLSLTLQDVLLLCLRHTLSFGFDVLSH